MDETVKEILKDVRVASPCAENWNAMSGSDHVRSCERCQHKVYNLSEMTAPEAADLLRRAEGRLCVRFYRRSDGTVMTKDCPVGAQAVRQRQRRRFGAVGLSMASVAGLVGATMQTHVMGDVSTATPEIQPAVLIDTPPPVATEPTAEPTPATVAPTPEPQAVMGYMFLKPTRLPQQDKPFLQDTPVEQTPPREDPFAREKRGDR